jgi:hypothetical protein
VARFPRRNREPAAASWNLDHERAFQFNGLEVEEVEIAMATNLVSYVMQFLTPDMIGRIAGALGLSRSDTQAGVGAVVPALLGALSGLAEKPGGPQSLVNTIKQQSGVVDTFATMIGGNNQSSFIERGSSLLTSLLGGHDQAALTGAVARFAGLGQNKASSLLGMLTPVVMGLIGKQIGTRGVDVGSLTSLFASQREQIAQAMPAGMSEALDRAGLTTGLESLRGAAGRAATGTTAQFPQYTAARERERAGRDTTFGIPNWAYWVLPLIVLGGLLWYLLGRPGEHAQVAQREAPAPTQQAQPPQATISGQNVVVGGVDVKNTLGDSMSDLRTSLQGVTDVASANAALPKLEAAKTQIDKVSGLVGQLTPDQRKVVAGVVATAMPTINRLSDKVLEIPGVADVLRPTLDPAKTKLAELSGEPGTVGSGR